MNVYDSQRMADLAVGRRVIAETPADRGRRPRRAEHLPYPRARVGEDLFRTREDPRAESRRARRRAARRRWSSPAASRRPRGAEILRRQPAVDIVVGPQNYHRLPELLSLGGPRGVVDTEFPLEDKFDHLPASLARSRCALAASAPSSPCRKAATSSARSASCPIRAARRTRGPVAKILAEIEQLARGGRARIHADRPERQRLSRPGRAGRARRAWPISSPRAARIPGVLRLRYSTSHPHDMSEDLIRAHAEIDALAPYLHLPVQSGSDRILAAMNRRQRRASNISKSSRACGARGPTSRSPRISSSAFPARPTPISRPRSHLVREVGFASAYAFKYSPRPGTPAADAEEQVAPRGQDRAARASAGSCSRRSGRPSTTPRVGRRFDVIFDKPGRHAGQLIGRTPYMQSVHAVVDPSRLGELAEVEIDRRQAEFADRPRRRVHVMICSCACRRSP